MQAVDGVTFSVDAGEVVAIVGESGSGKSVTAMTLMGLTRGPNSRFEGRALFDGHDVVGATDDELRRIRGAGIAMVFQDPMSSLNPVYRVGRQIAEQIRIHEPKTSKGQALDRSVELMERVGIPRARDRARSYPHEFSGGMRQRVMIAMALSNSPQAAHRRRADDRARCHDPGADPRRAAPAARRDRSRDHPGHPRSGRGRRHRRPDRGDVRRPRGRAGDARRDLLRPPAPLHVGSSRLDHASRPRPVTAPAGDPRPSSVAPAPARGLPFPSSLSARVRSLPRGSRADRPRAGGAGAPRPVLARGRRRSGGCARSATRSGWPARRP